MLNSSFASRVQRERFAWEMQNVDGESFVWKNQQVRMPSLAAPFLQWVIYKWPIGFFLTNLKFINFFTGLLDFTGLL